MLKKEKKKLHYLTTLDASPLFTLYTGILTSHSQHPHPGVSSMHPPHPWIPKPPSHPFLHPYQLVPNAQTAKHPWQPHPPPTTDHTHSAQPHPVQENQTELHWRKKQEWRPVLSCQHLRIIQEVSSTFCHVRLEGDTTQVTVLSTWGGFELTSSDQREEEELEEKTKRRTGDKIGC